MLDRVFVPEGAEGRQRLAIWMAGSSCHSEWNSTMMSIGRRRACRIFSKGSSAA
jgi:hypothetical protein